MGNRLEDTNVPFRFRIPSYYCETVTQTSDHTVMSKQDNRLYAKARLLKDGLAMAIEAGTARGRPSAV